MLEVRVRVRVRVDGSTNLGHARIVGGVRVKGCGRAQWMCTNWCWCPDLVILPSTYTRPFQGVVV